MTPDAAEPPTSVPVRSVRAYLGIGANQGDAPGALAWAIGRLGELPGVRVRGVSRLFATRPVGVEDQPDFRNAAVALDIRLTREPAVEAMALLERLKAIEREAGRRPGRRWGPRPLDLDLLVFGRHVVHVPRTPAARSVDPVRVDAGWLDVPHVSAPERAFVLAPLADLAPGLVPPGWGRSVATALRHRTEVEGPDAVRPLAAWDPVRGGWVRDEAHHRGGTGEGG